MGRHHGYSQIPIYKSWEMMIDRCRRQAGKDAHRYLNRGIRVCKRWHLFVNFLKDMGPTWKPGLTLDRRNNDGNYKPSNCRWATRREQALNREKRSGWKGLKIDLAKAKEITAALDQGIPAFYLAAKFGVSLTTINLTKHKYRRYKENHRVGRPKKKTPPPEIPLADDGGSLL